MKIQNDQAMRELQEAKRRADKGSDYDLGLFLGAAGAYMVAGVISSQQYLSITEPKDFSLTRQPESSGSDALATA